jgi:hypothetical protein
VTLSYAFPSVGRVEIEDEDMNRRLPGSVTGNSEPGDEMIRALRLQRTGHEAFDSRDGFTTRLQHVVKTGVSGEHEGNTVTVTPREPAAQLSDYEAQRLRAIPELQLCDEHLTLRNAQVNIDRADSLKCLPAGCALEDGVQIAQQNVA